MGESDRGSRCIFVFGFQGWAFVTGECSGSFCSGFIENATVGGLHTIRARGPPQWGESLGCRCRLDKDQL
jgi:hypothetical protein